MVRQMYVKMTLLFYVVALHFNAFPVSFDPLIKHVHGSFTIECRNHPLNCETYFTKVLKSITIHCRFHDWKYL